MVNISKFGDSAIKFTFTDNDHYLFNGEIEVPINSLLLVLDESDMATFKKIDGDPFVSFLISNSNFASKSDLENFYIANMVGSTGGGSESGITSGDVQTMIDTSLEDYYDIDEIDAALSGKADSSAVTAVNSSLTAHTSDTDIHTTAVEKAAWNAKSDFSGSYNDLTDKPTIPTVPTSNTAFTNDAGYITDAALEPYAMTSAVTNSISAATDDMATKTWVGEQGYITGVDLSNYATNDDVTAAVSGKADSSSVYTKSEVDTALSGKQDISGMTAYTTSSDVETYVSGYTYDKATIDSKVASGGTFDPTNYYDKTATDALLDNKFDASAFTSYSAATDARISEDEEVTAAALNALNDGKQDTLIAGSGITISGNVISAEGGNLVIELTEAEYDALVDKNPNAFYIITDATEINISDYYTSAQTQSAINAAVSGKQDTLIAGSGITISGNVISANGGGSITVDTALDSGSTNPVENRVIYNKFDEVEQVTAAALNALNEELSGKADSSDVTDAINSAVSGKADTSSVYTKSEVDTALNAKQNTLIAGSGITISGNVISSEGGGVTVDSTLDTGSTNPVANSAITNAIDDKIAKSSFTGADYTSIVTSIYDGSNNRLYARTLNPNTNGRMVTEVLVYDTTITSNGKKPVTGKAVYDTLGGLKLVKLSQSEYDSLATKDNSTLYVIVN